MKSKILWILISLELAAAAGAQDASGQKALRLVLLTPSCAVVEVNARAPGSLPGTRPARTTGARGCRRLAQLLAESRERRGVEAG